MCDTKQNGLTRRRKSRPKRYRRTFVVPRPGDLLQVDIQFVPYLIEGRRLYQYTAIDCCTRLRIVQFSEEMAAYTSKAFIQYALSSFPFPIRTVQTDNDSIFTHWYTAGPKIPLDRPVKLHPFTTMCYRFGAQHRLIPPRTPRLKKPPMQGSCDLSAAVSAIFPSIPSVPKLAMPSAAAWVPLHASGRGNTKRCAASSPTWSGVVI